MTKPEIDIDAGKIDAFLRERLPDLTGPMELQRIAGGQSNPTYFVSYGSRRYVLRRRPSGPVLPSAHAIDREHRIMSALRNTDVPVPSMVLFHAEADVVGTAFYVMERVEGRVFDDCTLPGVSIDDRRSMYLSMANTLAGLHRVDWKAVGLADFGRPQNYFERQIARWTKQWNSSKTRGLPDVEWLVDWLPLHIPSGTETAIAHGDFRIGNLMFHPTEPRVVAVLDWELATLGHPSADLAYSALAWRLRRSEYMGMQDSDLKALGIPSEQEYVSQYCSQTGTDAPSPFHYAFALFRLAIIFEGIAARAKAGTATASNAGTVGELSAVFARKAVELVT